MPQGGETKENSTGTAEKKQDEVKTSNPVVVVNEAKPETKEGMQLMLGGSSSSGSQPPAQQHSPGSTSSVSSNGSHAGYTRQNNPRPRSYKHSSNSSTGSSAGSTSGYQTTSSTFVVPPPPPQPVYAPPPPPVDYSPGSYAAATSPVPMQQPPPPMHYGYTEMTPAPGCSWVPCGSPYPTYQPSGAPYDVPTIVQAPPPQASPSAPRGRYTPSPHSVSGSSSPSSFCQTSNSTTTATTTTANGGQHVVNYHVHQGEVISLQLGDGQVQVIPGPATIRMVSTNSSPPLPLPMQVPPGHMVQQILDQNGTLQHVILSLDPMAAASTTQQFAVPMSPYAPVNGAQQPPQPPVYSGGGGSAPPPRTTTTTPFTAAAATYGPPPVTPIIASPAVSAPAGAAAPPIPPMATPSQYFPPPIRTGEEHRRIRGPTHERLIKKANRMASPSTQATPPTSPAKRGHKENNNFRNKVKSDPRQHDDSEESGVGHEEEEETSQLLLELLSNIRTPKVSEVLARSAHLQWGPPVRDPSDPKFEALEPIPDSDYRYEVLLSDKGKDGKYRPIFTGPYVECRLTDLRPYTEYHIRIHAILENLKGGASDTMSFQTQACEPDQPFPPKLIQRSKTSINLRWNAPSDNGAHIQVYVLEYDEGKGDRFTECFTGRAKSYNVTKLQSSTQYRFRLYAVNELGRSRASEVVNFATQGTAPSQPQPPGLKEATKSSLHLVWSKRICDEDFILQMDDHISGHGFLPVYNGPQQHHISTGLRRNTAYKFRLQAHNEEGKSHWSEEVSYRTLPDIPGPPLRPASKGRLYPNSFKVRWDPPTDDGGSEISGYILEIDGGHGWHTVYQGPDLEFLCDSLTPGTQYKVRVACQSTGGVSEYSDVCHISTEPVCPGQCAPPRLHGKPKATSLHLKWGWPEFDGGAHVTEFEIEMTPPDNRTRSVYRGQDTECLVASLLPGRPYLFQVRAYNRAGAGSWSDPLEVVSGAGAPDQPKEPRVSCKSPTCIAVQWEAPINNGAIINDYRLEMAALVHREPTPQTGASSPVSRSLVNASSSSSEINQDEDEDDEIEEELEYDDDDESLDSEDEEETRESPKAEPPRAASKQEEEPVEEEIAVPDEEEIEPEFSVVYSGPALSYDVRNLEPATTYLFRVSAQNSSGPSAFSGVSETTTPAAPPATVAGVKLRSSTASALTVTWQRPSANGENITHYNVDTGSAVVPTPGPDTFFVLTGLRPDSAYSIRVQAVNSIGPGPFSPTARLSTRPLPPAPPKCECVNVNHNSLKLKWGDAKSTDFCHYTLEMENSRNQFQVCYTGTSVSHKINKLSENTKYRFRICAANDAGQGPFSQVYEFTTAYAHPIAIKAAPRVSNITEDGCLVEWTPVKLAPNQGDLHYKVQLTKVREQDAKIIYTGTDVQFRVSGLDPKSEYSIKVAAVRVPAPGIEIPSAFSSPGIFTTLFSGSAPSAAVEGQAVMAQVRKADRGEKTWTDQQWAFVILFGFTLFAVLVAVVMQQVINWGKVSL